MKCDFGQTQRGLETTADQKPELEDLQSDDKRHATGLQRQDQRVVAAVT